MDMRIPTLKVKILLESNPPKSRILARRLALVRSAGRVLGDQQEGGLANNPHLG